MRDGRARVEKMLRLDVYLKFRFPKIRMLISAAMQIFGYAKMAFE
jgi:hypothetical protein